MPIKWWGILFPRTQNRGTKVKIGSKGSYKRTRTKGSNVWHNEVHKNICYCQGSSLTDVKYTITIISEEDGRRTHNKILSSLAKEIWDYLLANGITITVEYLPGVLNQEADFQSSSVLYSSEWKLDRAIFQLICIILIWTPDINLFASGVSHQVPVCTAREPNPFSRWGDVFQQ